MRGTPSTTVQCRHCLAETTTFVPALHAGAIGQCPNCNCVLTRWIAARPQHIQDILAREDREVIALLNKAAGDLA